MCLTVQIVQLLSIWVLKIASTLADCCKQEDPRQPGMERQAESCRLTGWMPGLTGCMDACIHSKRCSFCLYLCLALLPNVHTHSSIFYNEFSITKEWECNLTESISKCVFVSRYFLCFPWINNNSQNKEGYLSFWQDTS